MSYETDKDVLNHRTGRIAILSLLIFGLATFVFCYKVNACKDKPDTCKDEFFEIKGDSQIQHACSGGATVEVVNSPPAPKPGIICHCAPKETAPSPSASR